MMEKKRILDKINPVDLFGPENSYLNLIQRFFSCKIISRGFNLILIGEDDDVERLDTFFEELILHIQKNKVLSESDLHTFIQIHTEENTIKAKEKTFDSTDIILYTDKGPIRPRTRNQEQLLQKVRSNDVVFGIGPAGTGKTYLAVAIAVSFLKSKRVKKIILTRPVVQAGEDLGFLPGNVKMKVNPYLRPLFDALEDFYNKEHLEKLFEQEVIEIAPLAYMRGRTLNNAFIILDEAQNTTNGQMKMFLTRLGISSKMIITGDITQIDLPKKELSGLLKAQMLLKKIEGIYIILFNKKDIVRHRIVQDIFDAYEKQNA